MTGYDVSQKYCVQTNVVYEWARENGIERDTEIPGNPYIFRVNDEENFVKDCISPSKLESLRNGRYYKLANLYKICGERKIKYVNLFSMLRALKIKKIDLSNTPGRPKYRFDITTQELEELFRKSENGEIRPLVRESVPHRLRKVMEKNGIKMTMKAYNNFSFFCNNSLRKMTDKEIDSKIDEFVKNFKSHDEVMIQRIDNLNKIVELGLIDFPISFTRIKTGYLCLNDKNSKLLSGKGSFGSKEELVKIIEELRELY